MAINSKAKGKRGELAWCRFCGEFGYTVRRTAQFCGNNEAGAADCIGIRGIHQEVKFVEHLNIQDAMDQSIRDARKAMKNEVPIVAHKRSNCEWLVTMRACDFLKLYKDRESELVLQDLATAKCLEEIRKVKGEERMIVLKTEGGSIIMDPKEICVEQDLEGDYYVFADVSDSGRVKQVRLTALPHDKEVLFKVVDDMYDYIEVGLGQGQCRNVCLEMSQIVKLRCDAH